MKVLHVIPSVAARYGGPSAAIVELSRALEARAHEVLVATTDADGPGRLPVPCATPVRWSGAPCLFFPRQASEAFKLSLPLAAWVRESVAAWDVVHIHGVFSHACLAAAAACRRRGVPYVVRPLGTLDPWSMGSKRWRKRMVWLLAARRMLTGAATVHYTSEGERAAAEASLGLKRGVVVPLGVDAAGLEEQARAVAPPWPELDGRRYVLALGRLHPKKALEPLIEAFLDVELPGWDLVLAGVGDEDYTRRLRMLLSRRAGEARVRLLGWVEGPARAWLLANAGLVAQPSLQENFGLSAVEGLALGVPVLVGDATDLAPVFEAAGVGWSVAPERAALRELLARVLADDEVRRARGALGRALVRDRYSWSTAALALEGVYSRLVAAGAPPPACAR